MQKQEYKTRLAFVKALYAADEIRYGIKISIQTIRIGHLELRAAKLRRKANKLRQDDLDDAVDFQVKQFSKTLNDL